MDIYPAITQLFSYLDFFEDALWGYLGVPLLMFLGLYLSIQSKFVQIRKFPLVVKRFISMLSEQKKSERGVHPLQAFFACIAGCVGVGNIAGICTAVQIGGPGALFWIWVTAIAGMMVKYGEVFLGIRYRVPNNMGGYNGGPMYFLQHAFKARWIPAFVSLLLCIYGVEVYQFSIVTDSIVENLAVNRYLMIAILLGLVLFGSSGGVRRVGNISSAVMPLFIIVYIGMGLWVLLNNLGEIPLALSQVLSTAFTGSAAVGGFVGSTLMVAMSQGVRRGCYTGDLGVGYASVIHSESSVKIPQEQASLVFVELFLDAFVVCTTSIMLILVTAVWHEPVGAGMMVQMALGKYFPYMNFFMPFFLFLLGYSTIIAYFCVGIKSAEFLSPKRGKPIYYAYAIFALITFSFIGTNQAQTIMTIANGLLLVVNCLGIYRLRKEISFVIDPITLEVPADSLSQPAVPLKPLN